MQGARCAPRPLPGGCGPFGWSRRARCSTPAGPSASLRHAPRCLARAQPAGPKLIVIANACSSTLCRSGSSRDRSVPRRERPRGRLPLGPARGRCRPRNARFPWRRDGAIVGQTARPGAGRRARRADRHCRRRGTDPRLRCLGRDGRHVAALRATRRPIRWPSLARRPDRRACAVQGAGGGGMSAPAVAPTQGSRRAARDRGAGAGAGARQNPPAEGPRVAAAYRR